ncbi:hypothetical protein L9F63_020919, partial [Diploptera punctata]
MTSSSPYHCVMCRCFQLLKVTASNLNSSMTSTNKIMPHSSVFRITSQAATILATNATSVSARVSNTRESGQILRHDSLVISHFLAETKGCCIFLDASEYMRDDTAGFSDTRFRSQIVHLRVMRSYVIANIAIWKKLIRQSIKSAANVNSLFSTKTPHLSQPLGRLNLKAMYLKVCSLYYSDPQWSKSHPKININTCQRAVCKHSDVVRCSLVCNSCFSSDLKVPIYLVELGSTRTSTKFTRRFEHANFGISLDMLINRP